MKARGEWGVSHMRLVKASTFMLAGLLTLPGVDALVRVVGPPACQTDAAVGIETGFLARAPDAFTALEQVETMADSGDEPLPADFDREVGVLASADDVRVSGGGAVVGYSVSGEEGETLERLMKHMEARGWKAVPLGGACGATFVKPDGAYTWALATCTQVGSTVSVVIRM